MITARLVAFIAVAESGSVTQAARRSGISKSVISERLADLERSLSCRLIQRTTRRVSLTEDGAAFLVHARRIVREAAEAASEMAQRRGSLSGPLRLSGPVSFGNLHLGPALYGFLREHPDVQLTLDLDDRFVDVAGDGYDAVIRHGPIRDSRLVAKRLATSRRVLVAAPSYLDRFGTPKTIDDLEGHKAIIYANREADWRFTGPDGVQVLRPKSALRVNNCMVMRDAASAGLGFTLLPTFTMFRELASGALRIIDVGWQADEAEIYIAYLADQIPSTKIKALTDWLRREFGDPPYWEGSEASAAEKSRVNSKVPEPAE